MQTTSVEHQLMVMRRSELCRLLTPAAAVGGYGVGVALEHARGAARRKREAAQAQDKAQHWRSSSSGQAARLAASVGPAPPDAVQASHANDVGALTAATGALTRELVGRSTWTLVRTRGEGTLASRSPCRSSYTPCARSEPGRLLLLLAAAAAHRGGIPSLWHALC